MIDDADDSPREVPRDWLDVLAESDADLVAGRVADGAALRRRLGKTLADMRALGVATVETDSTPVR